MPKWTVTIQEQVDTSGDPTIASGDKMIITIDDASDMASACAAAAKQLQGPTPPKPQGLSDGTPMDRGHPLG